MRQTPRDSAKPSLRFAFWETLREGYNLSLLRKDILAGATVGVVAVPLAMALAIASGAPPQYGLYTAIVAGALIALCGGSRLSISGPTAAFVVILLPITHKFGIGGLLIATAMSGIMLIGLGVGRFGTLIQFIPYPVTTGFTAGIAVVIATLQIKDFLGLDILVSAEHFFDRLHAIAAALPSAHGADFFIGVLTFTVLLLWDRLKTGIPRHLAALAVASLVAYALPYWIGDFHVATVGSRFTFNDHGATGHGIPAVAPSFVLPWNMPGADGAPIGLSFELIRQLIGPAFGIALLGAIESLLCAVVVDGIAGTRHDPNAELIGQGVGNLVAPFFGGITATAAIARSATNIRAGGVSPIAALVHSAVVLLAVVSLADLLAWLPMAALAAVLILIAWNISDAKHFVHIVRVAPRSDVLVLLTCFTLTVMFDMVLAVSVGVMLASLLFIRRMADLTTTTLLAEGKQAPIGDLPGHIIAYEIRGPLFFGAAEKAVDALRLGTKHYQALIIDMANVPAMDMTGIVALESVIRTAHRANVAVVLSRISPRLYRKLRRSGLRPALGLLAVASTLESAKQLAIRMRPGPASADPQPHNDRDQPSAPSR